MTLRLKSLKPVTAAMLESDSWTIEKLATATAKELIAYKGIGRVGASKIIAEAAELLNEQGFDEAKEMAMEHYYQKSPPAKILKDWESDGLMTPDVVALASAGALSILKSIDEALALRLISEAQDIVNRRGLYQSGMVATSYSSARQANAAFDEKWLSGAIEPPPMSIRVKRNFERAQREYKSQQL